MKCKSVIKNSLSSSLVLFLFASSIAAASCLDIANKINSDINKYPSSIENAAFPWKNLTWLKDELGEPTQQTVVDNKINYLWACGHNHSANVSVAVNNKGDVVSVSGIYSSADGAGMFAASFADKPVAVAKAVLTRHTQMVITQPKKAISYTKTKAVSKTRKIADLDQIPTSRL